MILTLAAHILLWAIPDAETSWDDYRFLCYSHTAEVIVIEQAWLDGWAAGDLPMEQLSTDGTVSLPYPVAIVAYYFCWNATGEIGFYNRAMELVE